MRRLFLYSFLLLGLFSCTEEAADKLRIAAAANLQFAMPELLEAFTKESGIECELITGSSGKLTAQIKEGAPFEVFISANAKYPNSLYKDGFTSEAPKIYAIGKLALWTNTNGINPTIDILSTAPIENIAIPNPKNAPYGKAAEEALKKMQLFDKLREKIVYGESVSQTNQFIMSGSAQIGLTALSVVISPKMKGAGKWIEIDPSYYSAIEQGIVIVKKKEGESENARKFYNFMFSEAARGILLKHGYGIPK